MNTTDQKERLLNSLAQLETCLETPIVPGGLPKWVGEASEALATVGVQLRLQIEDHHQETFAEIAAQDPELSRRVEEMKAEDCALIDQHEQLLAALAKVCEQAAEGTPTAVIREDDVSAIIEQGLELVIRVRKQEKALTTWFVEAFNRDRGVGD